MRASPLTSRGGSLTLCVTIVPPWVLRQNGTITAVACNTQIRPLRHTIAECPDYSGGTLQDVKMPFEFDQECTRLALRQDAGSSGTTPTPSSGDCGPRKKPSLEKSTSIIRLGGVGSALLLDSMLPRVSQGRGCLISGRRN